MLLTAGVPVHVVAERLGDADPAITLRVYAHVIRPHAAGVADTFAAVAEQDDDQDYEPGEDDGRTRGHWLPVDKTVSKPGEHGPEKTEPQVGYGF